MDHPKPILYQRRVGAEHMPYVRCGLVLQNECVSCPESDYGLLLSLLHGLGRPDDVREKRGETREERELNTL